MGLTETTEPIQIFFTEPTEPIQMCLYRANRTNTDWVILSQQNQHRLGYTKPTEPIQICLYSATEPTQNVFN